jgi:hypothetical protein
MRGEDSHVEKACSVAHASVDGFKGRRSRYLNLPDEEILRGHDNPIERCIKSKELYHLHRMLVVTRRQFHSSIAEQALRRLEIIDTKGTKCTGTR